MKNAPNNIKMPGAIKWVKYSILVASCKPNKPKIIPIATVLKACAKPEINVTLVTSFKVQYFFRLKLKRLQTFPSATFYLKKCNYCYAVKALTIPKTEASITRHFQQLSLFIFIFIDFRFVKIHTNLF